MSEPELLKRFELTHEKLEGGFDVLGGAMGEGHD